MKQILFSLSLVLAIPLWCCAQQNSNKNYRDSLVQILTQKTSDSIKVRTSFLLAEDWSYTDTVKSKQYLEQGRRFSDKSKYLLALYNFYNGQVFTGLHQAKAEKFLLKSDSLLSPFKTKEAYLFRGKAWLSYGLLRERAQDIKAVLSAYEDKALPLITKSGDENALAELYGAFGMAFARQYNYSKAQPYFDKALTILKRAPKKEENSKVYMDASTNLFYLERFEDGKELVKLARPLIVLNTQNEIEFRFLESLYFLRDRYYQNTLNSLKRGLQLAVQMKSSYYQFAFLRQQYETFKSMGNYQQAKNSLLEVLKNSALTSVRNRQICYYELGQTYAKLGDTKEAGNWQRKYATLYDSISKKHVEDEMSALKIKFRNAENQKKITELNATNERAKLAVKNERLIRWLLISVSLFLLILAIFGLFFYRNSKKLAIQKELNYRQQLKEVEQQQQMKIAQAVLNGQEEERNRVARDLHDGLGGMLATVKMNLSDFVAENENDSNKKLPQIVDQLDHSLKELRRIAHNMVPEMLLKLGLETSIKDLCYSIPSDNLAIDFQSFGMKNTLLIHEQIAIYRIVQELLTNVVKHAQAKHVLLQCSQDENIFLITIEDDGKGFDYTRLTEKQGMGLFNIKNRVSYLNGKIEISTNQKQKGTIINIELDVTA